MFDLLKINNYTCPKPASYQISTTDKLHTFEAEDGTRTIETVRQGIYSISVGYNGLTQEKLAAVMSAITKISQVTFYDAFSNAIKTKRMEVTGLTTSKGYYDADIIVFNLSFKLEEL